MKLKIKQSYELGYYKRAYGLLALLMFSNLIGVSIPLLFFENVKMVLNIFCIYGIYLAIICILFLARVIPLYRAMDQHQECTASIITPKFTFLNRVFCTVEITLNDGKIISTKTKSVFPDHISH